MAPALAVHASPVRPERRSRHAQSVRRMDEEANISVGPLVGILLGAVIVLLVLAKLIVPVFDATADVNTALNDENVTTGDDTADSIKPVFGVLIGLSVLLGFVGLILAAVKFSKSG